MPLAPGTTLGHYRIVGLLGSGGMGEVYRALDTRLGREVALKMIPDVGAGQMNLRSRLEQEARLLAALNHPNIVNLHSVEEHEGVLFLTMELVSGRTLAEVIPPGGMEIARVLDTAIPIAAALAAAHERGIVHRDLKPANVMVLGDGQVKVLDFGVAQTLLRGDQSLESTATSLTAEGHVVGTVHYMSPEQAQGLSVDARSDLFAFGVILYELITGQRPFGGETSVAVISALLKDQPVPLSAIKPDTPPELVRLVRRCLEKDPGRRVQSAVDVLHELEDLRDTLRVQTTAAGVAAPAAPHGWLSRHVVVVAGISAAALAVVILAFIVRPDLLGTSRLRGGAASPSIGSLAVLPLENLSKDPAQEFFADGMTEQLITDLAQVRSLRVISRTSVMRFKGSRLPVTDIARQLDVDAIIEGSVLRQGGRVRITAQLIGTQPERHLWARSYDREVNDVLAIQSEIARAVADEVHLELTPSEQRRLESRRAVKPEAFEAYLRGKVLLERGGSIDTARRELERAVQIDPEYPAPYAALADFWAFALPPQEAMERARAAAQKAIALDESVGEAHASLGLVHLYYDWDFDSAGREFRRALELSPGSAQVVGRYVEYCWATGATSEAVAAATRAAKLDPFNLIVQRDLGRSYYFDRQYDRAVEEFRRYVQAAPNSPLSHLFYGIGNTLTGNEAASVEGIAKASDLFGNPEVAAAMRRAYASGGYHAFLEVWGRTTEEFVAQGRAQPPSVAMIYARAGDKDKAFEWLEKSFASRSRALVTLKTEPQFDPLRSDPRFADLVRRMRLPN